MSTTSQILLAGAGTYFFRISFILVADRFAAVPTRVETMLAMIPPAVLAAIAAESLLFTGDDTSWRGLDEWHLTILIAGAIAWRTKRVALCLVTGMPVLWGLAAVG